MAEKVCKHGNPYFCGFCGRIADLPESERWDEEVHTCANFNPTTQGPNGPEDCPACEADNSSEPSIRKGPVKVQADGILYGRVGDVKGFLEAGGQRLCMVTWETGGWTFFAEDSLVQLPGRPKGKFT